MIDSFIVKLKEGWRSQRFLCVGLDPDLSKICPDVDFTKPIRPDDPRIPAIIDALRGWAKRIYDATEAYAIAYKPNFGFWIRAGIPGIIALACVIDGVPSGIPVILDGKFNDIGDTVKAYADGAFHQFGVDAVTSNAYLGVGELRPFFDRDERFTFVLGKTSNKGSGEFQDQPVGSANYLYELVARAVEDESNRMMGGLGLVAGATHPDHVAVLRRAAPTVPLLVPGVGKQGGDLRAAVLAARTEQGGFILNVSSAIGGAADPAAVAKDYHEQLVAAFTS